MQWYVLTQFKVLTIDLKVAFGHPSADVIADIAKKLSSVCPVDGADGQHSVAIMEAKSVSRYQRFAIFHPLCGRCSPISTANQFHRGFTFYQVLCGAD